MFYETSIIEMLRIITKDFKFMILKQLKGTYKQILSCYLFFFVFERKLTFTDFRFQCLYFQSF